MRYIHIIFCILTFLFLIGCSKDNNDIIKPNENLGSISGKIIDANLAITSISVETNLSNQTMVSSNGTFAISNIIPGTHTINILPESHYYNENIHNVTVISGNNTDIVNISLRDLYPDAVLESNGFITPNNLIGIPLTIDSTYGGWLILLDMGINEEIQNIQGADLEVLGGMGEGYLSVSNDLLVFDTIPIDTGSNLSNSFVLGVNTQFDLGYKGISEARYVKIELTGPDFNLITQVKALQ